MLDLRCRKCGLPYPSNGVPYSCPTCGGLFDYHALPTYSQAHIQTHQPGLWKYRAWFELDDGAPQLYLGEGGTPLVEDQYGSKRIFYKLESLNPTGSYKDRGSALLCSFLATRGVTSAVEDSSGNAGASFAAYAARAGIRARVYVPASASGPKLNQIRHYGAELVPVEGPRSKAAEAVLREVAGGAAYASHAFLPFGLPGIATIAYEIFDQLGARMPGTVIAPAGHGALLLGLVRGFRAIQRTGLTDHEPLLIGVQAAACAPLTIAFTDGPEAAQEAPEGPTLAEGVRVRCPSRMDALLQELKPSGGRIVAISEEAIQAAFHALSRRGIYVEPTAALPWAALEQEGETLPEPIVLILSGFGLKLGTFI